MKITFAIRFCGLDFLMPLNYGIFSLMLIPETIGLDSMKAEVCSSWAVSPETQLPGERSEASVGAL